MKTYDKYKSSGIDWIGDIPEDWKIKKLKYLVETVDKTISQTSFLIAVENIESKTGKIVNLDADKIYQGVINEFQKGDVLFNKLRPYLAKVYFAERDGGFVGELLNFRASEELHGKFLFYRVFSSNFIDIVDSSTTGTKMPRASWEDFISHLLIAFPTLPEQTAIADYLDEKTAQTDKLIAEKRRLIELLKEERLGVINQAVTRGINRNAKLKPSGIAWLGDIPEHWEVKKLKFLTSTISKGTTPSTIGSEMLANGSIRFLKAENILQSNIVDENPQNFIDEETNEFLKRSELQESDILIVIAGATIGKVAILQSELLPANTNQAVCFIRLIEKQLSKWVHFCLQSRYIKETISLDAVQSAQPNLSMEKISNFIIFLPPIEEQKQIVEFIETATGKIDATIATIEKEIGFLREYRTALISEVVTGKIKVI